MSDNGISSANGAQFLQFIYDELRLLARGFLSHERPNHTLSPTALVNELYLKIADNRQHFPDQAAFKSAAAQVMRRILVDHARGRLAGKRGGGQAPFELSDLTFEIADHKNVKIEELDDALTRLGEIAPRQTKVVEMRYFGGMTADEIAKEIGVSTKTVKRDWVTARSWLRSNLGN